MSRCALYKREHRINDFISIRIPTIGEILQNEEEYFGNIALIVSTPYDMMVQLDSANIDFSTINDWELFCLLFNDIQKRDYSLIFGDLNFRDFDTAISKQTGGKILINRKTGAKIDLAVHHEICKFLRQLLHIERKDKKPANEEGKRFMIERAKKKLQRSLRNKPTSQIESYIVALVNTSEFHYDYNSVLDLTIYQFYASLHQIVKKVQFDKLMIGCYAGTVNMKELDQKELHWIPN